MINHKYKVIFIHIPKTAGTSVKKQLGITIKNHPNLSETIISLSKGEDISKYFIFTFVRNPWDRFLSLYKYLVRQSGPEILSFSKYAKNFYREQPTKSSDLRDIGFHNACGVGSIHYYPQYYFIKSKDKKCDFIGKFENLQEDFNIICDEIGIPKQQLPHKNKSKHKHYTEYYDEETKQIVAEKYAKDIEYFGYKFGE